MSGRTTATVLGTLLFCAVVAACSGSSPDPGPRFDDETANGVVTELTCMKHQPRAPGPRYTDDNIRRTDETLALLRYYTANGAKPYCDGNELTEIDRQWIDVYLGLGADEAKVERP
ncbi:hypothetical protein GCM10027598_29850 [Amycolatopsis oliviviridis]|uniref:Lipoprotein n=1 Tax=Amycolatopsis oliviviridis TaxID=1471590 RepID=A0ABQ3LSL6_9PSEU|nr:hypothetical protein [Amycolatopsis oliviviridis]GHH25011.1 hypothetical protein GCM10017790_50300 [Amycolatopsis oliviviridis]